MTIEKLERYEQTRVSSWQTRG